MTLKDKILQQFDGYCVIRTSDKQVMTDGIALTLDRMYPLNDNYEWIPVTITISEKDSEVECNGKINEKHI